jgi:ABC-2 type transport system ATP-binding protein
MYLLEQPILQVQNLTKKFDNFTAVNQVNFSVIKNEIFGFLGPNGAGKTTTINMLTGLARPTSGTILFGQMDYTRQIKKAQKIIGIVPDESNLYEEMDGFQNLTFCASLYGIRKAEREERARALLAQFDLVSAGKKPFKVYSKGMKRKLTIAAGIIHHPTVLFLDEPTTGIDVASARQIRALIKNLNATGTTIFMTTHYIEEAERLCDRIAFIVNGRIVQMGMLNELMEDTQKEKIIQFAFENAIDFNHFETEFCQQFQTCRIEQMHEFSIQLRSAQTLDLMPFMSFFHARGIKVLEAKIIKPSLEEVFVKITGIERGIMNREKEGKKK